MRYPFTEAQFNQAADEWGCNCGPSALAFALQRPLSVAGQAIPEFKEKQYTSPTMMRSALVLLLTPFSAAVTDRDNMFSKRVALVRIQWTGPWTAPDVNPKWKYRQTHWICTWLDGPATEGPIPLLFDCNGGIQTIGDWEANIVPALTALYKRADGGWHPTHIWRLEKSHHG
jgi:hypothetical protein